MNSFKRNANIESSCSSGCFMHMTAYSSGMTIISAEYFIIVSGIFQWKSNGFNVTG